jgi:hypothetical protein
MQSLAVGWQIYNLTDSPFDLGLVGLMQFLPLVSLMLVAGQAADRYNRQAIVQLSLAVTLRGNVQNPAFVIRSGPHRHASDIETR